VLAWLLLRLCGPMIPMLPMTLIHANPAPGVRICWSGIRGTIISCADINSRHMDWGRCGHLRLEPLRSNHPGGQFRLKGREFSIGLATGRLHASALVSCLGIESSNFLTGNQYRAISGTVFWKGAQRSSIMRPVYVFALLAVTARGGFLVARRYAASASRGQLPHDARLQPLKDLNGYFSVHSAASKEAWAQRAEFVRRQMSAAP